MSLSMWFRHRTPILYTYYRLLAELPSVLKKRVRTEEQNYHQCRMDMCSKTKLEDKTLDFYVRCIVEGGYQHVIEIGSHKGNRLAHLKSLFPDIRFYGLDIQEGYKEPFSFQGVDFRFFDLDFLADPRFNESTLLLSHGTICYIERHVLDDLFHVLRANKINLAFAEPALIYSFRADAVRRSPKSHYYNYKKLLPQWGFEPRLLDGRNLYRPSMAETRLHCLAVPRREA